jgi:glutamyl/glutaminyl-tRNA synthetase
VVGRLAPTPSGRLHLGNALAFGAAWLSARAAGGRILLRIEDVDLGRARPALEASIRADLAWLGLDWDEEVRPQRERNYEPWLDLLREHTYFCTCTRATLANTSGRYLGTCRDAGHTEGAIRLRLPEGTVRLLDRRWGPRDVDPATFGDPVLRRRDLVFTYPLAVVADDLADGVTEVVRGADLLDYSGVQIRLWQALGATPPTYLHTPMLLGRDGRKLSKSHTSTEVASLRAAGLTPREIWRRLLPLFGIDGVDCLAHGIDAFRPKGGVLGPITVAADDLPSPEG